MKPRRFAASAIANSSTPMARILPFHPPTPAPTQAGAVLAWLKSRYAALAKAPDWKTLPAHGRALRMRGLVDDEARALNLDTLSAKDWETLLVSLDDLMALRLD